MYDDGCFDERIAAIYDDDVEVFDPKVVDLIVDFLIGLAGRWRVFAFGIGTGRIALPLARQAVLVHGIGMSKAMVSNSVPKSGVPTSACRDYARRSIHHQSFRAPNAHRWHGPFGLACHAPGCQMTTEMLLRSFRLPLAFASRQV